MKIFISHAGFPKFLNDIKDFLKALGIEPILAERTADNGGTLMEKIDRAMSQCDCSLIVLNKAKKDSNGKALTSDSVNVEIGKIIEKFKNKVIFIREKGVEIATICAHGHQEFTRGNLAPVFRYIVTEIKNWDGLAIGPFPRLLNEDQIYALDPIKSLTRMYAYVPVGFWAIRDDKDPKVKWIQTIQDRLRNDSKKFCFWGVYGLPMHDKKAFNKVKNILIGFEDCRCQVRVFSSHNIPHLESNARTDAPGLGLLILNDNNGNNTVLVACASKPGSVRVDSAFAVSERPIFDLFNGWFQNKVAKLGTELHLSSKDKIARDLSNMWSKHHPRKQNRND